MQIKAFKEWTVICQALAQADQSLIIRKGGISEGKSGFSFESERFLLFPTYFHAQNDKIKSAHVELRKEHELGDQIELTHLAELTYTCSVAKWETVQALDEFHIWSEETMRERFDWQKKSDQSKSLIKDLVHVAIVRIYELPEPFVMTYERAHHGCKSWIDIKEVPELLIEKAEPVLSQRQHESKVAELKAILI